MKPIKIRFLNLTVFLLSSWILSAAANEYPLEISIEGLRSSKGSIALSVYSKNESSGFPDRPDKAIDRKVVPIENQSAIQIKTMALPPGEYAIALMHDENGDSKFNTTVFGIPKEGFGFSNNPTVRFGPPSISKTLIQHRNSATPVKVKMKYMF